MNDPTILKKKSQNFILMKSQVESQLAKQLNSHIETLQQCFRSNLLAQ